MCSETNRRIAADGRDVRPSAGQSRSETATTCPMLNNDSNPKEGTVLDDQRTDRRGEIQTVNIQHTLTDDEGVRAINEAVRDATEQLGFEVECRYSSESGIDEQFAREWQNETILLAEREQASTEPDESSREQRKRPLKQRAVLTLHRALVRFGVLKSFGGRR